MLNLGLHLAVALRGEDTNPRQVAACTPLDADGRYLISFQASLRQNRLFKCKTLFS